jgi:hypothetical protein
VAARHIFSRRGQIKTENSSHAMVLPASTTALELRGRKIQTSTAKLYRILLNGGMYVLRRG